MNDINRIDPPQSPDDPHCVHCHCLESMHVGITVAANPITWQTVTRLFCPNDSRQQFEPYSDGDYARDEDDAREDAALARRGL